MAVPAVRVKDKPRRAGVRRKLHGHFNLKGNLRLLDRRQAERAAPESRARFVNGNASGPLPPASSDGLPVSFLERTNRRPLFDGNGIRFFEQRLQRVDDDREAQVVRHLAFQSHQPVDSTLMIEQRATTVSTFDRDRDLDHRLAVDFALLRDDAADDAVFEAERIADCHNRLARNERVGISQFKRFQIRRVDSQNGEVRRLLRRVDCDHVELFPIGKLNGDRSSLADHVQVGRDEAVLRNDEATAEPQLRPVSTGKRHDDDRLLRFGCELLHNVRR